MLNKTILSNDREIKLFLSINLKWLNGHKIKQLFSPNECNIKQFISNNCEIKLFSLNNHKIKLFIERWQNRTILSSDHEIKIFVKQSQNIKAIFDKFHIFYSMHNFLFFVIFKVVSLI